MLAAPLVSQMWGTCYLLLKKTREQEWVRHGGHGEASHELHQGGIGIEDIAARFGVSAHTVRQRLRLASITALSGVLQPA